MPVTLDLPTVLVTTGSTYATKVNAAIQAAADATHTGGANGDKWTAASLGIDGNVSWGGYSITALKATTYTQQASLATANSLYVKTDGTLHFVNGSSVDIAITSGAGLATASLITATWAQLALSGDYTILPALNYTHFLVSTAAARVITLPSASAVGAGRFYVIQDVTGSAASNNITINRAGSDTIEGGTSATVSVAYGWIILVSDGTSAWATLSERDATASRKGRVMLAQDLGGTAAAPTVVALTGSANKVTVASGTTTIEFNAATSAAEIRHAANATTAGGNTNIVAQAAGGSNQAGGIVNIIGGNPTGTGTPGSVTLQTSVSGGLRVGAFSSTRRYVSLSVSNPSTTDLPTGDGVVYIGNAVTNPSSNPVGGGVLYVDAGALKYRGTSGTVTTLGAA